MRIHLLMLTSFFCAAITYAEEFASIEIDSQGGLRNGDSVVVATLPKRGALLFIISSQQRILLTPSSKVGKFIASFPCLQNEEREKFENLKANPEIEIGISLARPPSHDLPSQDISLSAPPSELLVWCYGKKGAELAALMAPETYKVDGEIPKNTEISISSGGGYGGRASRATVTADGRVLVKTAQSIWGSLPTIEEGYLSTSVVHDLVVELEKIGFMSLPQKAGTYCPNDAGTDGGETTIAVKLSKMKNALTYKPECAQTNPVVARLVEFSRKFNSLLAPSHWNSRGPSQSGPLAEKELSRFGNNECSTVQGKYSCLAK